MSTTTADNLTIEEVIAPGLRLLRERRAMLEEQIRKVDVAVQALVALAEPAARIVATPVGEPYSKKLTLFARGEIASPASAASSEAAGGGEDATQRDWVRRAAKSMRDEFTGADLVAYAKRDGTSISPEYVRILLRDLVKRGDLSLVSLGRGRRESIYSNASAPAMERKPDPPAAPAPVPVDVIAGGKQYECKPRFARDDTMPINPSRVLGRDRKRNDEDDLPEELKER